MRSQEALHKQIKAMKKGIAAAETKHAAYTEALTTQMKQGLLAAVKQCKTVERTLEQEK